MGDVEERVEDAQYESELEDLAPFLRRRREATDDDEEVEECETVVRINRRLRMDYTDESDGLDGLPEYYDNVSYIDELEELAEEVTDDYWGEEEPGECAKGRAEEEVTAIKLRSEMERDALSVPKVGAFYMHDDRFGVGRSRRQRKNWNLWELKEEAKWKHDKFEEMKLQETHNAELNASKAQRASTDCCQGLNERERIRVPMLHDNSVNEGNSSKKVRGRGPVRYRPLLKSSSTVEPQTKRKELVKPPRSTSKTYSARVFSEKNKQPGEILGMNSNTDPTSAFSYTLNAASYSYELGFLEFLSSAVQSKDALAGNGSKTVPSITQVGGLHFGGLGDPVLVRSLTGYACQSQVGFGNSKMFWFPALWGNAGALGATYSSAFVTSGAVSHADSLGLSPTDVARLPVFPDNDGAVGGAVGATYSSALVTPVGDSYPNSIEFPSSYLSSGQASTTKHHNDIGPSVKTVDGEHWRQKNKSRRYSRMKLQE